MVFINTQESSFKMLSDREIALVYDNRRGETHNDGSSSNDFGPEDLIGRRIVGTRIIHTNGGNPDELRAYDFEDGSLLVLGIEGHGEDYDIHAFLIDPKGNDKYTSGYQLISPSRF